MNRNRPILRSKLELEQALAEWIAASRRAYFPSREPRDEQEERAAWLRVQSALCSTEPASAAA